MTSGFTDFRPFRVAFQKAQKTRLIGTTWNGRGKLSRANETWGKEYEIIALHARGLSLNAIAKQAGVSKTTAHRIVAAFKAGELTGSGPEGAWELDRLVREQQAFYGRVSAASAAPERDAVWAEYDLWLDRNFPEWRAYVRRIMTKLLRPDGVSGDG